MKLSDVFVSQAEYARLRGVEATYINQLRRNGRLVLDKRGQIAVHASDELIASTRIRQPRRGSAGATPGHPWAARATRPPRDGANALQRMILETMLRAANALAPRVAELSDPADCRAFLAQELHRAANTITIAVLAYHHDAAPAIDSAPLAPPELPLEHDR